MKDCKCGRIPPCYGGKKFRIHEELEKMPRVAPLSEETAQEMIKTLEDFSKSLVVELKTCELINLIFENTRKSIKSDDMEEKKIKKMTKAEAFEYFKGKRVVCDKFNLVDIQCKFFEVGIKWRGGSAEVTEDRGRFLFVDLNGCLTHCNSRAWFDTHEYEETSADDILSIEIIEENCELEFNYDKAVELAKPLMHYLSETRHTEVIVVCMEGISAIPMGTFLYKG